MSDDPLYPEKVIELRQQVYTVALTADQTGQYLAGGLERGIAVYDWTGELRLTFPATNVQVAYHIIVPTASGRWYLANRLGTIVRLDVSRTTTETPLQPEVREVYQAENDVHSLAYIADGTFTWLAIGHLSPALTVLDRHSNIIWRRHPSEGNATSNRLWSVAAHPEEPAFYIASGGVHSNTLARVNADTGKVEAHRYESHPITRLATTSDGSVLAVLTDSDYQSQLVAYGSDLRDRRWELLFDEPITALGVDATYPLAAIGVGYRGRLLLINTQQGSILDAAITLHSVVNGIALLQAQKRLATGTKDGTITLFSTQIPGMGEAIL